MKEALEFLNLLSQQDMTNQMQQQFGAIAQAFQAHDQELEALRQALESEAAHSARLQAQINVLADPTLEIVQTVIFLLAFVAVAVIVCVLLYRLERRIRVLERSPGRVTADLASIGPD